MRVLRAAGADEAVDGMVAGAGEEGEVPLGAGGEDFPDEAAVVLQEGVDPSDGGGAQVSRQAGEEGGVNKTKAYPSSVWWPLVREVRSLD